MHVTPGLYISSFLSNGQGGKGSFPQPPSTKQDTVVVVAVVVVFIVVVVVFVVAVGGGGAVVDFVSGTISLFFAPVFGSLPARIDRESFF